MSRRSPEWLEGGYVSPLVERVAAIRRDLLQRANDSGWVLNESLLTDQTIIRRMVLKRCIYGVDKNPVTVELAKVSLWLHSFTVGAPLSFLDHHLRCGDSLAWPCGCETLVNDLQQFGSGGCLFGKTAIAGAEAATESHATHRGVVGRRRSSEVRESAATCSGASRRQPQTLRGHVGLPLRPAMVESAGMTKRSTASAFESADWWKPSGKLASRMNAYTLLTQGVPATGASLRWSIDTEVPSVSRSNKCME